MPVRLAGTDRRPAVTADEQRELKRALVATALYYRETIPDEAIRMYAADLDDLPLVSCLQALQAYRRDPRHRRSPLPADVRTLVHGDTSADSRAKDIAARLHGALVRYGLDWPSGYWAGGQRLYDGGGRPWRTWRDAAVAELGGADALDVLDRLGGWTGYHSYANFSEPTTVAAQVRGLAASVARLDRQPCLGPGQPDAAALTATEAKPGATSQLVAELADRLSPPTSGCGS
jgi:hypothetical protein